MSAVHATKAETKPETSEAPESITPYLDTLYEIIATGVEPAEGVSLAEIEAFVHEHAREPKSLEGFKAFFAIHRLATRLDVPTRPPMRILEPLPSVEPPPAAIDAPAVPPDEDDSEDTITRPGDLAAPVAKTPSAERTALLAVAVAVLVVVGATLAWSVLALVDLRAELTRAQIQAADNLTAIRKLDDQADGIRSDIHQNREVMRSIEHKHDVLMDTLVPAPVDRP